MYLALVAILEGMGVVIDEIHNHILDLISGAFDRISCAFGKRF
jgi:hypothetical protein